LCRETLFPSRFVGETQIYECRHCRLAVVGKNNLAGLKNLYDFRLYQHQEKRRRKKFGQLAGLISGCRKQGKVLEIGSGFGLFASILNRKGDYRFTFVDPNIGPRYKEGLKFKWIKTSLSDFRTDEKYDLIILFDVIEHFDQPISGLRKINLLLKDDGYLIIQTPNYESLMAKLCPRWSWWMVEDHKYLFSPLSIRKILYKTGFLVEKDFTYETFYDFKKNLDGNFVSVKNALIRKTLKVVFFSFFFPLYFLLRGVFWRRGWGGLIFIIGRKKV